MCGLRVYVPFCTAISDYNLHPLPINSQNQYRIEYLMGMTNKCVCMCGNSMLTVLSHENKCNDLNEAAFQLNNIQSQYSVHGWSTKCWCYLFFFPSVLLFLLLFCLSLTHSIVDGDIAPQHRRWWMRVSKHRPNANRIWKYRSKIGHILTRVFVFIRSFAWLFHCWCFYLPRETKECVVFFPFAGSNSNSNSSSIIGVWAGVHVGTIYRCQESNTKLWKCIVSATVEMSITAQYVQLNSPPFDEKLLRFHWISFDEVFLWVRARISWCLLQCWRGGILKGSNEM